MNTEAARIARPTVAGFSKIPCRVPTRKLSFSKRPSARLRSTGTACNGTPQRGTEPAIASRNRCCPARSATGIVSATCSERGHGTSRRITAPVGVIQR